ncbi:amino acid ABC transporter permease [Actinomarinicola tropica]|uniref:ABC transporter permease subunit n=1 Tax=Actinomarinicola tropica TaxID=2789776 RepID=A0A5Q2RH29_9ACTN|nr:amino acid ABC transporter permease [Actinomarinicola tropica]QGG96139.1 ABC transporter permease subunit [Actinomarinicola tropica]
MTTATRVRGATGPLPWVRSNLFNSTLNSVLTVVFGGFLGWAAYRLLAFVFVNADWEIVRRNLTLFMVGRFDRSQLWRPWAAGAVLALSLGLTAGMLASAAAADAERRGRSVEHLTAASALRRFWPLMLMVVVVLSFTRTIAPTLLTIGVLALGAAGVVAGRRAPAGFRRYGVLVFVAGFVVSVLVLTAAGGVGWDGWSGLHLNLFVTFAGIILAFPLGLLLALGRRSRLPAVRIVSVAYIEFFRGVPLIALLIMAQLMIGFFLPPSMSPPSLVVRALVAIVIFESAYIAEIVRGGLQSVPRGQIEAGQAVGLSTFAVMRRIVLPQALRAVIPAMVGQFISLFQDTTLLFAITLTEVLAVADSATSQDDFVGRGLQAVTLPFVAFLFWAVSYSMSRESRRLETRLGVGVR